MAGVCGPKNIEVQFEASGIRARPIEMDLYINRSKFDYSRIRFTRDAGVHILEHAKSREPVSIYSNGIQLGRFMLNDVQEDVSLTEDEAYVKLSDQLKILQHRIVNKTYTGRWTAKDIIDDLYFKGVEEDVHGVFTAPSYWNPSGVDLGVEEGASEGDIYDSIDPVNNTVITQEGTAISGIPLFGNLVDTIGSGIRNNVFFLQDDADYDWEDISVWECLSQVREEFGLDIWVSKDGILQLGDRAHPESGETNIFAGGLSNNALNMTSISTPSGTEKIKQVILRGRGEKQERTRNGNKFHAEGRAKRTDIETGQNIVVETGSVRVGPMVESAARNLLIQKFQERNGGSITVDPLSSERSETSVKNVKPGDLFGVQKFTGCRKNITGGIYFVKNVHHKLNNWEGWSVNLDIIPLIPGEIKTSSYIFDPEEEVFIETSNLESLDESEGTNINL